MFDDNANDDIAQKVNNTHSIEDRAQEELLAMPFKNVLPPDGVNLKEMVTQIEVDIIRQALDASDGVVSRAAEMLQMRRTTLVEKIKKYGLSSAGV